MKTSTTTGLPLSTRCVILSHEVQETAEVEVLGEREHGVLALRVTHGEHAATLYPEIKTLAYCHPGERVLVEIEGVWAPAVTA